MSKGTVVVEVQADTKKAAGQIKQLKTQVESTKGGLGLNTNLGNLNKMIPGLSSIQGSLGGLGDIVGTLGASAGAFGAVGAAIGVVGKAFSDTVARGTEARKEFEKIAVSLQNVDRNIGGAGRNMDDFVKELEVMSATGVNSVDDLGEAAKTLMIALGGSKSKTMELLSAFDDLAAGTGVNVSEWASMAAEVNLTGVSIKDLTKLSNRGIAIYQALGKAMGVTAEEAESMAKKGLVGTEDWTKAVLTLSDSYKGLSKELSSKTLEGAEKTFEAMKKLRDEAAGEGYSDSRKRYLNGAADRMQAEANNPAMQAELYSMGQVKGNLENFGDELSTTGDKLIKFGETLWGWLQGKSIATQQAENMEEYKKAMARKDRTALDSAYKNRETLTSAQIKDIIDMISSDQWGAFSDKDGKIIDEYVAKRDVLRKMLEDTLAAEEKARKEAGIDAETARKEAMTLKYGTSLEDKIAAVSGHHGIGQIEPNTLESEINRIKKGLIDGTIENVQEAEKNLQILEPLLREYNNQLSEEARKTKDAADEQKRRNEAALNAKIAEDNALIQTKGHLGEQITAAQAKYDTVTSELNKLHQVQSILAEEENNGIFRKKWGNLNVSDVSTKEEELAAEQREAAKRLDELKRAYNDVDQKWATVRTNMLSFFTSTAAGNVVRVKGTPLAG